MQGIVKKLTDKNFGFIAVDGKEKEVFFHANELQGISFNDLKEGDTLTFEIEDTEKGPAAVKINKA